MSPLARIALALQLTLGAALGQAAQEPDTASQLWAGNLPGSEGALDNATFVTTSEAAATRLLRGDRELVTLADMRDPNQALVRRVRDGVYDDWRAALEESDLRDVVPGRLEHSDERVSGLWPDPDGTAARRFEAVDVALRRRLATLDASERAAWRARFGDLAAERLLAADQDARQLQRVERDFPGTDAAALAALALGDRRFELGQMSLARGWFERADEHIAFGALSSPASRAARERREAALRERPPEPPRRKTRGVSWERADGLTLDKRVDLRSRLRPGPLGNGVRPGLLELTDGRIAIQGPADLYFIDLERGGISTVDLDLVVGTAEFGVGRTFAPRGAPGWRLAPVLLERDLVLVHGRVRPGDSNALLRISPPPGRDELGLPVARLEWVVQNGVRKSIDGEQRAFPELLALPGHEFQPGVARVDSLLLVSLRAWELAGSDREVPSGQGSLSTEGAVRSYAAAFDAGTGDLLWLQPLAKGFELSETAGRGRVLALDTASPPPLIVGAYAFFATNLGSGTLLALDSGRPEWTFLNRRRALESSGWDGALPLWTGEAIAWAPADSDRLYWLNAEPRADGAVLARRPQDIGSALALLDADSETAAVLARVGTQPTLAFWELESGARREALYLDPSESFTGRSLASRERIWATTERALYLFDRTRDGLLLGAQPYGGPAGGDVFGVGDKVLVVGGLAGRSSVPSALWVFETQGD